MGSHRHWVSARDPSGRFVSAKFAQAAVRQSERNLSAVLMVELRDGLDGGKGSGDGEMWVDSSGRLGAESMMKGWRLGWVGEVRAGSRPHLLASAPRGSWG